jgi:hypothetical protein
MTAYFAARFAVCAVFVTSIEIVIDAITSARAFGNMLDHIHEPLLTITGN